MLHLEEFYNYLYFIGFKMLLVDNKTWIKINNKYSIKIKSLTDLNTEIPTVTIMVVNGAEQMFMNIVLAYQNLVKLEV